jgi:hypothetical protein
MSWAFSMDKTSFEILTYKEGDKTFNDHSDMNWKDRFKLYMYLK